MDWNSYKYVLAVARTGTLTGAARMLDVSHATVHRQIGQAEKALGSRLFTRSADGYRPLEVTQRALNDIAAFDRLDQEITRKMRGQDDEFSGQVSITVPTILMRTSLMDHIAAFARQHAGITLSINGGDRLADLGRNEADIAIRFTIQPPADMIGHRLAVIHTAVFESINTPPEPDRWVGWADSPIEQTDAAPDAYRTLVDNGPLRLAATESGLGRARLPLFFAHLSNKIVQVPEFPVERLIELWLLYHPDMRRVERIRKLSAHLTEGLRGSSIFEQDRDYSTQQVPSTALAP